jgi:ABC-type transport system substrate-binding protein
MMGTLRTLLLAGLVGLAGAAAGQQAAPKTLRYAFPIAESSFDPAQISDLYSRTVAAGIFDAPLEFAFMARPFTLRPNTAAALPDVSADFRSFTIRLKPGILFDDDPALGGRNTQRSSLPPTMSIPSSATTTRAGRAAISTSWKTPRSWA